MFVTRRALISLILIALFIAPQYRPAASVSAETLEPAGSTITVTITADEYDAVSNGQCSLREAITAANTDAAYGGCIGGSGADIIMLEAGTYTLSIVGPFNDTNSRGDLDILADVSIIGAGSAETIVDGDLALDRVFDVLSGATVLFESMKITNGAAPTWHISGDGEDGGGIRSSGDVTLMDVVLIDNHAGNGIMNTGNGGSGGGIYSSGTLSVIASVFQDNFAGNGADNTAVPSTSGDGGNGGGIMAVGNVQILNSLFMYNHAGNSGNGVIGPYPHVGQGGSGGAIYASATSYVVGSVIRENFGGHMGTGLTDENLTGGNGGGIYNSGIIVISTTTLSSNQPGNGYKNSIDFNLTFAGAGGGLYNGSGATAFIVGTGIHDNLAATAGLYPRGGGIFNRGVLNIGNTTIAQNQEPYEGGGIYNTSSGSVTINSSTIAYNRSQKGGGIFNVTGGSVTFMNTILAWNIGWQGGYDCNGVINSNGYNLIRWASQTECTIGGDMTGVIKGEDPLIGSSPLNYYGGETKTLIPETGSPVIDAGNPAAPGSGGNACLQNDQRGVTRPQAVACDIGAVEATPQFTVTKTVDDTSTYPGQRITYSITVTNIGAFDATNAYVYDQLPDGLIFAGPVVLTPAHPEAAVAVDVGDIPFVVTGLSLASGGSVTVTLPVTTDVNYPGGETIPNTALAFTAIPQTEGSDFINIKTGWRVMLPLIMR